MCLCGVVWCGSMMHRVQREWKGASDVFHVDVQMFTCYILYAGVNSKQRMQPKTSLISSRDFSLNCRPLRKEPLKLQTSPRALAGTAVKVGLWRQNPC